MRRRQLHLKLVRIEEKLDTLIALEQGLVSYSNDPTEIVAATSHGRRLHTFISGPEVEVGMPQITCTNCGVSLADCGSSSDSWYCK